METKEVAAKLVELCKQGKNDEAIEMFYDKDIVSIEADTGGQMPAEMRGIEAVRGKSEWWNKNHETHSGEVKGPFVNGNQFVVNFNYDITPKTGPMAGKRMQMEEAGLYTVENGKIVREEFFY